MSPLNNDYLPFIQFNPSLTGLSVRFVCPMIIKIIPLHLSRDKSLCPLDLNLNDCVITLSSHVVNTLPFLTSSCGSSQLKSFWYLTQFNRLYDNCDRRVFNFLADINKVTQEFISNINEFKISCSSEVSQIWPKIASFHIARVSLHFSNKLNVMGPLLGQMYFLSKIFYCKFCVKLMSAWQK